jgi:signal transduction histidine kinase
VSLPGSTAKLAPVSELPPPPLPPPGTPGTATSRPHPTGPTDWDMDRVKELAEKWFRPVAAPNGWLALVYMFASAALAGLLLAAMLVTGAFTVGLLFILVGVLLIVPFFRLVELFTRVEIRLAALAGHKIEPRAAQELTGFGPRQAWRAVTDPMRWRHVAFVAANFALAWVFFMIGSFPLWLAIQLVPFNYFTSGLGPWAFLGVLAWLVSLPVLAFAIGAIPRVAVWMAGIKAQVGAWFLGNGRLAAAEARVSTLSSQRQDILDAVANERRRIERNLHDGVQQQLVAIGLDLGMAVSHLEHDPSTARELIESARRKVQASIGELRQLGRGLHPAILEDRGIDAALSAIVSGAPIPISVQVDPDLDLSTDVAETVYFVANEALANVLKHANAKVASIHVSRVGDNVRVTVHDDGVGGADPARGTGLAGIRARVNAVDGTLIVTSPQGGPTTLIAELPRHE